MGIWVAFTFWWLWIELLWTCVQVLVYIPVVNSFGLHLRVELLDYMVTLHLTFWGTTELFSTGISPDFKPFANLLAGPVSLNVGALLLLGANHWGQLKVWVLMSTDISGALLCWQTMGTKQTEERKGKIKGPLGVEYNGALEKGVQFWRIKAKVGCDFCRNGVKCRHVPIYRDTIFELGEGRSALNCPHLLESRG